MPSHLESVPDSIPPSPPVEYDPNFIVRYSEYTPVNQYATLLPVKSPYNQ
jgi:hypothetical protein